MPDPQDTAPFQAETRPAWARGGPPGAKVDRFLLGPLLGQGAWGGCTSPGTRCSTGKWR